MTLKQIEQIAKANGMEIQPCGRGGYNVYYKHDNGNVSYIQSNLNPKYVSTLDDLKTFFAVLGLIQLHYKLEWKGERVVKG
jgi:hypothetical protein